MGLAYFVVYTGVVENSLCGGSLTGINMSHNADISGLFQ
jgi:hypothetical protein